MRSVNSTHDMASEQVVKHPGMDASTHLSFLLGHVNNPIILFYLCLEKNRKGEAGLGFVKDFGWECMLFWGLRLFLFVLRPFTSSEF